MRIAEQILLIKTFKTAIEIKSSQINITISEVFLRCILEKKIRYYCMHLDGI